MKIAVLFASHRRGGKHEEIKQMLKSLESKHKYDFIELSEINITPCLQECEDCVIKVEHRCLNDDFADVLNRLVNADMNLIIVPVYTPYPSKFVALMEKLLSVSYCVEGRPLRDKPTAIFYYCSVKIVDEMTIKNLWRQYLMDSGYFAPATPNYPFLNEGGCDELNDKYNKDITACIRDFVIKKLPEM